MIGQLVNTGRSLVFKLTPQSLTSGSLSSSTSSSNLLTSSSHNHVHSTFDLSSSVSSSSSLSSSHSTGSTHGQMNQHSKNGFANSTVIISGGPLSYDYALHHILFHYGRTDDKGSEHTIDSVSFPVEMQLYFYNSQLYSSWDEAVDQPNGLAAIAILIQLTTNSPVSLSPLSPGGVNSTLHYSNRNEQLNGNSELKHLFALLDSVKYKSSSSKAHKLSVSQLLPHLHQYITYEGSLTQPSCVETVQWIISNKPIYITPGDLITMRNNVILEGYGDGNFRPTQPINSRTLRTNIAHINHFPFENKYHNNLETPIQVTPTTTSSNQLPVSIFHFPFLLIFLPSSSARFLCPSLPDLFSLLSLSFSLSLCPYHSHLTLAYLLPPFRSRTQDQMR